MSLSIYHGNEDWILKGFGLDIEKAFRALYPTYPLQRFESFTQKVGKSKYHFFVQQGQLIEFVKKNGVDYLAQSICIFTHFDINQFPVKILNQCRAIFFMSSSQLSIAIANGLDSTRSHLVPLGVDQELHKILDSEKIIQLQANNKFLSPLSGRNAIGFCLRYWDKPAYTRRKRYKLIMKVIDILSNQLALPVIVLGPGWDDCSFKIFGDKIIYANINYKDYPYFYNMMKVFCSLSLHEGGPMPLLESLSCGASPVVTNTGFAFDVLGRGSDYLALSVDASIDRVIFSILDSYHCSPSLEKNRALATPFSFENVARKIMSIIK